MKKLLSVLIVALFVLAFVIPAFAEVDVKSEGTKITTAVAVDFQGATVTKSGSKAIVNIKDVVGNADISGSLAVGTGNAFTVSAAGLVVDTALYSASAGTGASKALRISADGTIYGY